ncbi:MAG: hypothetical protein K0R61_4990 [Microvirga sp.]|nr:hypothetical protein [Microvirga sp.]
MRRTVIAAAVALAVSICGSAQAQSRPGGCLKYGLGGAVAGHFAGGERLKGAIVGCALGIYRRKQYEREVRERNQSRNRTAERPRRNDRAPGDDDRWSGERSPYEDLGLPTGGEQARVRPDVRGSPIPSKRVRYVEVARRSEPDRSRSSVGQGSHVTPVAET